MRRSCTWDEWEIAVTTASAWSGCAHPFTLCSVEGHTWLYMMSLFTSWILTEVQPYVFGIARVLSCSGTSSWIWNILLSICFCKESSESRKVTISFQQFPSFTVDGLSNKTSYVIRLVFIFKQISHYHRQWDMTTWWSEIPCLKCFVLMWIRTIDPGVSRAVPVSQWTEKGMLSISVFVWISDSHGTFPVLHTSPSLTRILLFCLHASPVVS